MTKIGVIVGATREGRVTDKLANWVAEQAGAIEGVETEVVDLRDYPMPLFDEAISPRYNPGRKPAVEVQKWLDKVTEFDGYIVVTAEYNRSMTGVLKNAIDYLDYQMERKPAALVGHGTSGGAQAIANLRMALPGVGVITVPQALYFTDRVGEAIDDKGMLRAELEANPYGPKANVTAIVKSLKWYADALRLAAPQGE